MAVWVVTTQRGLASGHPESDIQMCHSAGSVSGMGYTFPGERAPLNSHKGASDLHEPAWGDWLLTLDKRHKSSEPQSPHL